jgi:hypothetical protein
VYDREFVLCPIDHLLVGDAAVDRAQLQKIVLAVDGLIAK